MSVVKKEEVCSQRLVPRFGEPAVGVPVKKSHVSLSDGSIASAIPAWMRPSSPAPEMSVSAAGIGCVQESFFKIAKSDTNVITKGNGTTNFQIQDHASNSFNMSINNSKGVLFSGTSATPSCAASDKRSFPPADESQRPNLLALDLELASCQDGKNNNCGSLVKEEKVDHGISGFSSAEPHKSVQITCGLNAASNSSARKLPNLDLNVSLDSVDSLERLSTVHGIPIQHQKPQMSLLTPASTISSRVGPLNNALELSNSYGLVQNSELADVTLDLQLKPPARPELGINWKGLASAPELSLSLFGNLMDGPQTTSALNGLINSEPAGSPEKVCEEAASPGSDRSPVEMTVNIVPSNIKPLNTTRSTNSGIDKMMPNDLVKKEPEEPSLQHVLNHAEKACLLEQQSVGLTNNCFESEKTVGAPQDSRKTGLDLNSDIFPKNNILNGPDVAAVNVPIPSESLSGILCPETVSTAPEVKQFVKREEPIDSTPSPAVARVAGHSASLMAEKSLPFERNVASPVDELRKSSGQPSISILEASCSSTDCKQPSSHIDAREDATGRPCDALQGSSNPVAESLVRSSQGHAIVFDGISQGSAEMDCSEDDVYSVSRFPTTKKLHGGQLGNGSSTEAGIISTNLSKEVKEEQDSETHKGQDSASLKDKVNIGVLDDDRCAQTRVGFVSHAGKLERQSKFLVSEKFKGKKSLKSHMNSHANNAGNSMHDAKTATDSCSTDRSLAKSTNCAMESTRQSPKTLDCSIKKIRGPEVKSEKSPHGKQAASCSEDHAKKAAVKMEHSEEVARQSDLRTRDSVLGEDSELDGASSSQPRSECGKVNSASEKTECDKSRSDACKTSSVQNETGGQLVASHWRDLGHAYVNRNERWERFMESEREKNIGEHQDGRHASDMINHQGIGHRYGGRGAGSHTHPRNFRGPRMSSESEITFGDEPISNRRRPFEDDLGNMHRIQHRRRRSPSGGRLMREMEIDDFHGREIPDPRLHTHGHIDDLPDEMVEERFFMSRAHRQHTQGDHGFMHPERSRSPVQRRGAPVHFRRGRSPEVMHRSPPLMRTERTFVPRLHHTRRHGSPDQMHPVHLAELHAEEKPVDRRKYRERRPYCRSLDEADEDMFTYHSEDDMEFAEGGGPRDLDGRFRNRLGHRARGEQDGYRHRGPQVWRDGDTNDNGSKKRRY